MEEEVKNHKTEENEKPKTDDLTAQSGGFRPARTGYAEGIAGGPIRKFFGARGIVRDEYETKLLDLARVTRVTGGGKRLRFRAVVIAGDRKGKIGIGIDKGKDVSQAIEKATARAKKNLINVVTIEGTIPHQVEAKVGPARILLKPQRRGRGLVAGGAVRAICDLAGIRNVSSKILSGSKNKLNNARATMEALKKLKLRS